MPRYFEVAIEVDTIADFNLLAQRDPRVRYMPSEELIKMVILPTNDLQS